MAMTLEERYKGKPKLLKFYKEKLLEPGWAGELDDVELAYIKSRLKKSGWLRHRWGFCNQRISIRHIREVARNGL
jgi:hypothetical protein